jgi:hypothetical protein
LRFPTIPSPNASLTAVLDPRKVGQAGLVFALIWFLCACAPSARDSADNALASAFDCLDRYHDAAARANFRDYFRCMDDSSVFVGTDAGEYWSRTEFMAYARPHFAKGKAWTMRPVDRQIHFTTDSSTAWFEELLDTRMKLCRGSGVMTFANGTWKIRQYVLSATVPNDLMGELIRLKSAKDDSMLHRLTH